ncbi:MAG: branched-chain amino acid transport system permease protein [Bradyrhizobium sp.]|jgi:branched-chain amino acid transport system permease protein
MPTRTILALSTAALAAAMAAAPFVLNEGFLRLATECLLLLTMAQMWNLLAGYAGLVSLGHQVFVAFGAYSLFMTAGWLEVTPVWVLPVAPLVSAVVAAVIAVPLFRLREAYFSIAMWVFAEIIGALTMKSSFVGGTSGLPLATSRLIDFDWFEPIMFWLAAALTLGTIGALYRLMTSSFGLGLMSVRDNDLAAMSVGVDVRRNQFIAFVLSAAGCGLAGALNFMGNLFIAPLAAFDVNWSVYMMFIVIIGGIGTLEGPILGVIIFFGLREIMTGPLGLSGGWYLVGLGVLAVAVMMLFPRGIWPVLRDRIGVRLLDVHRAPPRPAAGVALNEVSEGTSG